MRIFLLTCTLLLFPNFAASQERLPIQTRFGILEKGTEEKCNRQGDVCLDYKTILFLGDTIWTNTHLPRIVRHIEWELETDLLLLELWSGGSSCCTSYRFLLLNKEGVEFSEEFGRHGHRPTNFDVSEEQISFRLERTNPANIDHWQVTFDGVNIDIETIYEDDSQVEIAGSGQDVSRWLGRSPIYFWEDGTERNRFRQIISDAKLNCLRTSTGLMGSEFELKDGYVISRGMWPREGGSRHGYVAVEIETGRPFAVQMWGDELHYYGATPEAFPEVLQNWVQQEVSSIRTRNRRSVGNRVIQPDYSQFCS